MNKRYMVLDLETTGAETFKRFCNPLDTRHSITIAAYKKQGDDVKLIYNTTDYEKGVTACSILRDIDLSDVSIIVGQNIKFDLLWLWGSPILQDFFKAGGKVWDTQTVEYLIRGQDTLDNHTGLRKLNLDTLALKYGGHVKDSRIKELYKSGVQSNEIPKDMLSEYVTGDIENTNKVLQGQITETKKQQIVPLVKTYMEHYLAVCEMEYNGIYVNSELAWEKTRLLQTEVEQIENNAVQMTNSIWPNDKVTFNIKSLEHLSAILFGTVFRYVDDVVTVNELGHRQVFKTGPREGEFKTRKEKIDHKLNITPLHYDTNWITKKGFVETNDLILNKLLLRDLTTFQRQLIETVVEYREKNKLLTTYFYADTGKKLSGFIPLIHPHDNCIHTEFKTTTTKTGRLASNNPNVQNLAPYMLDIFESRWKEEGELVEFDYGQLEVCIAAYLAQDDVLIQEITQGVDIHTRNASFMYSKPESEVTASERKKTKALTFGLIYGEHFTTMSNRHELPLEECEKFVNGFYNKYTEIHNWHSTLDDLVKYNAVPTDLPLQIKDKVSGAYFTKPGEQMKRSFIQTITGKRYTYFNRAVKTKTGVYSYWHLPDIKNYPVQGTATDIVCSQVGRVFRELQNHRDKCVMINEIHDAILIDVKKEYKDLIISKVSAILLDIPRSFKETFGIEFNVPIKIDYKSGKNWWELKND